MGQITQRAPQRSKICDRGENCNIGVALNVGLQFFHHCLYMNDWLIATA